MPTAFDFEEIVSCKATLHCNVLSVGSWGWSVVRWGGLGVVSAFVGGAWEWATDLGVGGGVLTLYITCWGVGGLGGGAGCLLRRLV